MENHWNSGNYFEITAESSLYTCQSCQGYLIYLQKLAEKHGKTIKFEVKSHPKAITGPRTKKFINQ